MTIYEFVSKYNGKFVDYDKVYGPQCVDLAKQWQSDNGWEVQRGNAIDWQKNGNDFYQWIKNSPSAVPSPGDIIVFSVGQYGHIGIVVSANVNTVDVFNQNWPHGNTTDPSQITRFNYLSPKVVGWLHPKALDVVTPPPPPPEDPNLAKIRTLEAQVLSLQQNIDTLNIDKNALQATIEANKAQLKDLNDQLAAIKLEEKELDSLYTKLQNENIDLKKQIEVLKSETISNLTWGQLLGLIFEKIKNKKVS